MWRKRDDGYFKLHTNVRRRWRMKREREREKMIKREERHGSNTRRKDEFL